MSHANTLQTIEVSPIDEINQHDSFQYENVLVQKIYQSALHPQASIGLRHTLLNEFREDKNKHQDSFQNRIKQHLKRAIRISDANQSLKNERKQLEQLIHKVTPPWLEINAQGEIKSMSVVAQDFLKSSKTFYKQGNILKAYDETLLKKLFDLANSDNHGLYQHKQHSNDSVSHNELIAISKDQASKYFHVIIFDEAQAFDSAVSECQNYYQLTERELDVLKPLAFNLSMKATAQRLAVSEQTIKQHLKNIYKKCDVNSLPALMHLILHRVILNYSQINVSQNQSPYLNALANTHVCQLPEHKQLSYLQLGDPNGVPVLYFHSVNSSRLELLSQQVEIAQAGVRLICLDRTGYGYSYYEEKDHYQDYVKDVLAVIDALQLQKEGILSCSAGAPHALCFAEHFPERVTTIQCTSAVPTPSYVTSAQCESAMNDTLNKFFRVVPSLLRPSLELILIGQTSESLIKEIGTGSRMDIFTYSELDTNMIHSQEMKPYFETSMSESLRQGPKAWANENVLLNRDWKINFNTLSTDITFWHGTHDTLIPLEMVEPFIRDIKGAKLEVLSGETHLLVFRHLSKILPAFVSAADSYR